MQSPDKNLAVVSAFQSWMDGTCTLIQRDRTVTGLLDKAHFKWSDTSSYYKTVNIYKFSKEFSSCFYIPFLEAYQKAYGKNEYYEQVLKVITFTGNTALKAFPVSAERWHEIDDPADLETAKTKFASPRQKLSLMEKRYGGYWRFPETNDFCYLVNPYFPPDTLVQEMQFSFKTLLSSYPSGSQEQNLLAAKIFGIRPAHICVGNGAAELIKSLSETVFSGEHIAVPFPTFNEYPQRFGFSQTVEVKTDSKTFCYTAKDILRTVDESICKNVLLINPDNPSGHFLEKSSVLLLAAELKKRNVRLVFDESFIDFADRQCRYSLIDEEIIAKFPNVIVIKSISKSYGVPGLRLGVIVSSDEGLIHKITKANSIWNINSFAEQFLQIFDKYKPLYKSACDKIAQERKLFAEKLKSIPNLSVFESQANYIMCKTGGKSSSRDIAENLLEKHGILIKDLSSKKGFSGGNFIRLAVKTTEENSFLAETLADELKQGESV